MPLNAVSPVFLIHTTGCEVLESYDISTIWSAKYPPMIFGWNGKKSFVSLSKPVISPTRFDSCGCTETLLKTTVCIADNVAKPVFSIKIKT